MVNLFKKIIALRYFKAIFFISFIFLAIPLTVFVAQQQQTTKQSASFITPAKTLFSYSKDYQQLLKEHLIEPAGEILEVSISYDESKTPQLSFEEIRKLKGYVPHQDQIGDYTLLILDNQKRVLYSLKFEIPNKTHFDIVNSDGNIQAQNSVLKQITFVQISPWYSTATEAIIINLQGKIVSTQSLLNIKKIENKPNFRIINGADVVNDQNVKKLNINIPKLIKQIYASDAQRKVKIAVIGDKYNGDMDLFHKDVLEHIDYFLTFEPYHTRSSQIDFVLVDNNRDLQCNAGSYCNIQYVKTAVSDKGVPYDAIAVIVKGIAYGGAIPPIAAVGSPDLPLAKGAFVHELGHALLHLKDEYNYDRNAKITETESNKVYLNCFWGNPPALEWNNLVGSLDYSKGCASIYWYKPYGTSVMKDQSQLFFNAVSQKIINDHINKIAGPYTEDQTPPKVQILSPKNNDIIKGMMNINSSASDNKGITYVQLWIDNQLIKTTYVEPYTFKLYTTDFANGNHSLQIRGYDVAGNEGKSEQLPIDINNDSDKTPPKVEIFGYPLERKTIDVNTIRVSLATLEIKATDDSGIRKIEIYLDEEINLTYDDIIDKAVIFYYIEPHIFKQGGHTLYVKAYDYAGNQTTTNPISFNTINPLLEKCMNESKNSQGKAQCYAQYTNGIPFVTPPTPTPTLTTDIQNTVPPIDPQVQICAKLCDQGVLIAPKTFDKSACITDCNNKPIQPSSIVVTPPVPSANPACATRGSLVGSYCNGSIYRTVFEDGACGVYQSEPLDCQKVYPNVKGVCVRISKNLAACERPTSITPTTISSPIPTTILCSLKDQGDANCDEKINTDDFNIWRDEYYHVLTTKNSDFNDDGKTDQPNFSYDDLNILMLSMSNQSLPH